MLLATEPQGAQRGNAGAAGPGQGAPAALQHGVHPPCQAQRCGDGTRSVQGVGKTWRENPVPWEVWEKGGLGRVLAPLQVLASSGQEEGMALHFNLRSKRGAPLLPPGLQQQRDSCQAQLARPANEQAQ